MNDEVNSSIETAAENAAETAAETLKEGAEMVTEATVEEIAAAEKTTEKKSKGKEIWRAIKFVLFSMSAGLIQMGSFALLNELTGWSYWPCYLISLVLSIIWNFTLNRKFTFKSATNVPIAMLKVLGYYCVFTPLSTLLGNYLAETLGWNEYLVTFINMFLNLITEYLFDTFVVFRGTIDSNKAAQKEKDAKANEADQTNQ